MNERQQIRQTIAALETQRAVLGDAVVDTALTPLREKLATLEEQDRRLAQRLKYITVLFADVVDSTRMGQSLDAEKRAGAVLDQAYDALQRQAARFSEQAARNVFLENVLANRSLVTAWNAHRRTRHRTGCA